MNYTLLVVLSDAKHRPCSFVIYPSGVCQKVHDFFYLGNVSSLPKASYSSINFTLHHFPHLKVILPLRCTYAYVTHNLDMFWMQRHLVCTVLTRPGSTLQRSLFTLVNGFIHQSAKLTKKFNKYKFMEFNTYKKVEL